jgi:hypothetical protein
MDNAIMQEQNVTPSSLRLEARTLRRCSRELAGLGPPTGRLRRAYQEAWQGCASLERAARCDAAAGRVLAARGPGAAPLKRLFICISSGVGVGSGLIGFAVSDGFFS